MVKAIDQSGEQAIVKYELPARVEAGVPSNNIRSEDLVNGDEFVIRGVGRGIVTANGTAHPIFFQLIPDYESMGPVPMETMLDQDGKVFLTGKAGDGHYDDDGWAAGTYQTLTQSEIIIRAARKVTEQPNAGVLARLVNKQSFQTGNTYYTLE